MHESGQIDSLNMEILYARFIDLMDSPHPLIYIGLLLLLSYIGGKLANRLNMPRVSGYLVMGMVMSPSVLGLFHEKLVKQDLALITDIALAIIAFSIGGSLHIAQLKKLGRQIAWINLTEATGAFLLTTTVLSLFYYLVFSGSANASPYWNTYFPMALVIGGICAATAPAAVLAIVHEYQAKGPLTTILLGVLALDDAMAILFYGFTSVAAHSLILHKTISWQSFLLTPTISILLAVAVGGTIGMVLGWLIPLANRKGAVLGIIIGAIFLSSGLSSSIQSPALLSNMMLGFVITNFVRHHEDLFSIVEGIEEPIFGMFFTLAGAHLDLGIMKSAGWLVLLITLSRFAGKLLGCQLGARISHAPQTVRRYLGIALLPTAGVTVGLVLEAKNVFGSSQITELMVNGVLGSVVINELLTPFFVRFSLKKAGETLSQ